MYHFLKGKITHKILEPCGSEKLILDVNGIGYEISTNLISLEMFGKIGEETTVYTAFIVKEDSMSLYGFPTLLEKELFNLLHSVSGIGPKSALSIQANLTVSEICFAIINEKPENLSKAQGIGNKTANRIVLELKEKIRNWKHLPIATSNKENIESSSLVLSEARSVLQALGYSSKEINDAFSNSNGNHSDSESLVHFSLKWLSTSKK